MAHESDRPKRAHEARRQLNEVASELFSLVRATCTLGLERLTERLNLEAERVDHAGQDLYTCWHEEQFEHLATTRQGTCNMTHGMLAATKLPTIVFCVQQRMGPAAGPTDELIAVRRTFVEATALISGREGTTPVPWQEHDNHGKSWTWGGYTITEQELP